MADINVVGIDLDNGQAKCVTSADTITDSNGTPLISVSGSILHGNYTLTNNTATASEQTLVSYTLPANTLASDGSYVEVIFWGLHKQTASDQQTTKIRWGSTDIVTVSNNTDANTYLRAMIVRTGASAQVLTGFGSLSGSSWALSPSGPADTQLSATESLSGTVDIAIRCIQSGGVADRIKSFGFTVVKYV